VNVLVTGVGGGVGQGILKALSLSELDIKVFAADVTPLSSGLLRNKNSFLIPKLETMEGDPSEMLARLRENEIVCWLVGSEYEIDFAQLNRDSLIEAGIFTPRVSIELMKVANDKLQTAHWMQSHGFRTPLTIEFSAPWEAEEVSSQVGFPCIVKPRKGTSAKGVIVCSNCDELRAAFSSSSDQICQAFIDGKEYTCSVFMTRTGNILGPFCASRTLRGGSSWEIEVVKNPTLENILVAIGVRLSFEGSLNIQLIERDGDYYVIELNSRFSGTTAVRAHFGFNEPDFYLRSYLLDEELTQPNIRLGRCSRYIEEVFIESGVSETLGAGVINRWY